MWITLNILTLQNLSPFYPVGIQALCKVYAIAKLLFTERFWDLSTE